MPEASKLTALAATGYVREKRAYLRQYRRLLREIAHDRQRLAQLEGYLRDSTPCDHLPEPGEEISAVERAALTAYCARIALNLQRCVAQVAEIQAYINRIPDSGLRDIFTLHYINGYSWKRVAMAEGGWDESVPRKRHDRYLAKRS